MDKVKVPVARFSPGPGWLAHYNTCGQCVVIVGSALGDTVARLQVYRRAEQRLEWWQRRGERPRRRLCRQRGQRQETGLLHADSLLVDKILVINLPPWK